MHACSTLAVVALTGLASAQSFQKAQGNIPTGTLNQESSENVDFADIDSDGDWDAVVADGGDEGNSKNRIWINQGGLQGGVAGIFVDETGSRSPNVHDTSRDVEFADIDGDGDVDLAVANTSSVSNQSCRWLVNQGGVQLLILRPRNSMGTDKKSAYFLMVCDNRFSSSKTRLLSFRCKISRVPTSGLS